MIVPFNIQENKEENDTFQPMNTYCVFSVVLQYLLTIDCKKGSLPGNEETLVYKDSKTCFPFVSVFSNAS